MRNRIAIVLLALLSGTPLLANVISPSGLTPGTQYQLIFVTADAHNAVSSNIGDYNTFVATEALFGVPSGLPSGLTWTAVASTSTVSANVNAPSGALPVYNTDGQEVSATGVGIYTGALENLVAYDQYGNFNTAAQSNDVWTGSDANGNKLTGATLGGPGTNGEVGRFALDGTWLKFASDLLHQEVAFSRAFYALSSPITVPTPEPATVTLLGLALAMLAAFQIQRRRWR